MAEPDAANRPLGSTDPRSGSQPLVANQGARRTSDESGQKEVGRGRSPEGLVLRPLKPWQTSRRWIVREHRFLMPACLAGATQVRWTYQFKNFLPLARDGGFCFFSKYLTLC